MYRAFLKILFIFSAVPVFAQVDSNSVTVVASRNVNFQPDQASIAVVVTAPMTATLDDVLAVVQGTGITVANLTSVYQDQFNPNSESLDWNFTLTVPFSKLKDTNSALAKLQTFLTGPKNGFSISFSGSASPQASSQAVHAQSCAAADLLADAQAQAQKVAAATGRFLGRLLAIAGSTANECSIAVKFSVVGF
jgi:hypothetical protein